MSAEMDLSRLLAGLDTGVSRRLYVGRVMSKQDGRRSLINTIIIMIINMIIIISIIIMIKAMKMMIMVVTSIIMILMVMLAE